jgi:hypothetical protein
MTADDEPPRLKGARRLAVAGTLISLLFGALLFAAISRTLGTADEGVHLDYAWQVSHGQLPDFAEGPQLPHIPPTAKLPSVQWAAQHPPLFYVMEAPLVRGLVDRGRWQAATAAGRAGTIAIGLLAVLVLAWAAAMAVGGPRRVLWGLATASVAAPIAPFVGILGTMYNDALIVLTTTFALGVAILVLRRGLSWPRLAAAAVAAAAGMATRAHFVVTLLILLAALIAAALIHGRGRVPGRLVRGASAAVAVLAVTVAAIGWFYLRNVRLSGNWTGGHPEWAIAHLARDKHSLSDVLAMPNFWLNWRRLFFQPADDLRWLGPALLGLLAVAALIAAVARRPWRRIDVVSIAVTLVVAGQLAGTLATQAVHVTQAGGIAPRYHLPALLPIAIVLAAGALAWRPLRAYALIAVIATGWLLLVLRLRPYAYLPDAESANGIPGRVLMVFVVGIAAGVVLQAIGLRKVYALVTPDSRAKHKSAALPGAPAGQRPPAGQQATGLLPDEHLDRTPAATGQGRGHS